MRGMPYVSAFLFGQAHSRAVDLDVDVLGVRDACIAVAVLVLCTHTNKRQHTRALNQL